jgi:hypothetical protein
MKKRKKKAVDPIEALESLTGTGKKKKSYEDEVMDSLSPEMRKILKDHNRGSKKQEDDV